MKHPDDFQKTISTQQKTQKALEGGRGKTFLALLNLTHKKKFVRERENLKEDN